MRFHLYVGPLHKYYCADPSEAEEGEVTDLEEAKAIVLEWREALAEAIREQSSSRLEWDEASSFRLDHESSSRTYADLMVWTASLEHPEFERPEESVTDFRKNKAFAASSKEEAPTRFPNIVKGVDIWLPYEGDFLFEAPDPAEDDSVFGSLSSLARELEELNEVSWGAKEEDRAKWLETGLKHRSPLEIGARYGWAVFSELCACALKQGLPLVGGMDQLE